LIGHCIFSPSPSLFLIPGASKGINSLHGSKCTAQNCKTVETVAYFHEEFCTK
jgi:hypothetical protein